jgi:hypothetical protein
VETGHQGCALSRHRQIANVNTDNGGMIERMNKLIILLPILLLNACAATVKEVYTSEGKPGYSIDCSGDMLSWAACYEGAGKKCGTKGYEILNINDDENLTISGNQYGVYAGSATYRSMIIQCKE